MAIEIAEVIETGPGWNRVRGTDGNIYTLQGDYNWRSNNPGNIEYGEFAINQGAIGSGAVPQGRQRGFAIFPTLSAGEEARRALQFESPSYRDLTIEQAISRYAPPNENNTRGYIDAVTRAAGVPAGTKMSELTPQQQAAFLAAQSQVEGMRQGDIFNAQGVRLPPNEIPNMVGTALSVVPPPRVAPNPATMSPDLSLMRNPQMSSSARMAQVTPPLPQPRPNRMDIHPFDPSVNTPRPNADGSISTEVTRTVQLPDGSWANVPSLWWGSGSTVRDFGQMNDDQLAGLASRYEQLNGKPFPRYSDLSTAEAAAIARSNAGGGSAAPITGATTPLPRPRPASPMDIARAPGTTVATIPTSMRPGQSQIERITPMPSAREIAMAPGQTIATIPTSGIGQPPATRSVPSVPYNLQPTAREIAQAPGTTIATIPTTARPNTAQINDAARRAALTANQSNVERAIPTRPMVPTAPQPMNMGSRDSVANAALGQRVAQQIAPAFSPLDPFERLAPNPIVQPSFVPLNQPPIQVVPSAFPSIPRRVAPTPMPAAMRPMISPQRAVAPRAMPRQQVAPLRIVVQRDQQQQPVQVASNWAPQGYTNDGTGRIVSQDTGGVYYERHLR